MSGVWRQHLTELVIVSALFLLVSALGFVAARRRAPRSMAHLDEWGLGGRGYGRGGGHGPCSGGTPNGGHPLLAPGVVLWGGRPAGVYSA
ncbi:MAG: sodium:solute symporter, partial [Actinobacteria bacterium]